MADRSFLLSVAVLIAYLCLSHIIGLLILRTFISHPNSLVISGSPLIGATAMGIELWIFGAIRIPWNALTLLLPWAVFAVISRRHVLEIVRADAAIVRSMRRSWGELDSLTSVLVVVGGAFMAIYLINVVSQPLMAFDGVSMWFFKAKHFFALNAVDLRAIAGMDVYSPTTVWQLRQPALGETAWPGSAADLVRHPDYPPLFSLLVASLYTLVGRVQESVGQGISFLFLVVAAASSYALLRRLLDVRFAIAFTFLIVALPKVSLALTNSSSIGLADYALGVSMMLAIAHLIYGEVTGDASSYATGVIFASIAALIKNEGLVFLGIVVALVAVRGALSFRENRGQIWQRRPLVAAALALAPVVAWQIYIRGAGFRSDLIAHVDPAHVIAALPIRFLLIIVQLKNMHTFSFHNDYGWLVASFLLSSALLVLNRLRFGLLVYAVISLQWIAYFVVYLFTPYPVIWHMATSLDRLVLGMASPMILLLAISLSPYVGKTRDRTNQRLTLRTIPQHA